MYGTLTFPNILINGQYVYIVYWCLTHENVKQIYKLDASRTLQQYSKLYIHEVESRRKVNDPVG